jgi:aryl-alcohol dehydrogenase-like predicted oxidoreductase
VRLALGTAQFGLDYGIANAGGKLSDSAVEAILHAARASGIDTLDTAIAYGDAEARLGRVGVAGLQVVSKLPAVPQGVEDIRGWVLESARGSLARLGVARLHGLLLHRPEDLLGDGGAGLLAGLSEAQDLGLVDRVGVSVYGPADLDALPPTFTPGLVQVPFSVLDRRVLDSGWLKRLEALGAEVHARSVFLQGLLLMPVAARPPWLERWRALFAEYDSWLEISGLTPVQACLRAALSVPGIHRVVVGVDGVAQLNELVATAGAPPVDLPEVLSTADIDLLNPARWPA